MFHFYFFSSIKGVTVDLRLVLAIWYIVLFLVLWRQIGKIRGNKVFFVPEFFYFEKIISLTYLIPIQEGKQKGVPNFLNSITDAPEVMKLRFWVEKWLLRIFTVFFYKKLDLLWSYWAKLLKKIQKPHFFGSVGVAFFFGIRFLKKKQ